MNAKPLSTRIRRAAAFGSMAALVTLALLLSASTSAQSGAQAQGPLRMEIRIFNGFDEVTPTTAVQMYPAGSRDKPLPTTRSGQSLVAEVSPGAYDVQATWQPDGKVIGMRWALGLYVERYPDEAGRYIAAVNLKPEHGALQLRPKSGSGKMAWDVWVFKTGSLTPVGRPVHGDGYTLIALPAGRYDVSVRSGVRSTSVNNLEVVADRTSLHHIPLDGP